MDWIESVKKIRKAQENNQLVVFVGAGVSKNSDLPTWWELVKRFADEIDYKRCTFCNKREEKCQEEECKECYEYTQDEYLRIPEYYYQNDESEGHFDYFKLIQDTLQSHKRSNPIDDVIFDLLPHHIITTNYDSLLEKSSNLNAQLYTVVCKDSDLLSKSKEHYIIKMHGDLNEPDSIVLKESDYLDYEQKHTLISTFIRALLINHTFLFLGYSLNDYNLNLIIGWINYFRKVYDVAERPANFLVSADTISKYEKMRLEDKSIYVVELSSLPDELAKKVPVMIENPIGQKIYSFLKCIIDSELFQQYSSLSEILTEKYQALKSYRKISYEDLIKVQPLGRTEFKYGTELIFFDKEWYEKVASLLADKKQGIIDDTFRRAGITAIELFETGDRQIIYSKSELNSHFEMYLNNNYVELLKQLKTCLNDNTDEKIYYNYLVGNNNIEYENQDIELEKLIEREEASVSTDDYIAILLHKMRDRMATITLYNRQKHKTEELRQLFDNVPVKYQNAISYLKKLFDSSAKNMLKMSRLVDKQEERYQYNSNTSYWNHSYTYIWDIQTYAYDYYFFFKKNFLPMDYFNNPKEYLSYYIKAILCSYSPIADKETNSFFPSTDRRQYVLNEIDFDIFIKYIKPESLSAFLKKYSVQTLEVEDKVDIVKKYRNLCNSFIKYKNRRWGEYLHNFHIIVCLVEMDNDSKKEVMRTFTNMLTVVIKDHPEIAVDLWEAINYLVSTIRVEDAEGVQGDLIDVILQKKVYYEIEKMYKRRFYNMIKRMAAYTKETTKNRIMEELEVIKDDKIKLDKIIFLRCILPIEKYKDFISNNIGLIDIESLFRLVVDKVIPCNDDVRNRFIDTIKEEDQSRRNNPGIRTHPDWLKTSIDYCIILKLLNFEFDLTLLKPYGQYSEQLRFMMDPDNYEYSCVDTNNYMWQNLIFSPLYREYFVIHKDEILSEKLKTIFEMGVESRDQQKIVYGLLVDHDELREF